jgi:hypothetical protein
MDDISDGAVDAAFDVYQHVQPALGWAPAGDVGDDIDDGNDHVQRRRRRTTRDIGGNSRAGRRNKRVRRADDEDDNAGDGVPAAFGVGVDTEDIEVAVEDVKHLPLLGKDWIEDYPAPTSDYCYLCIMKPDTQFVKHMLAIAGNTRLPEEARCINIHVIYESRARRAGKRERPEWNVRAICKHLREDEKPHLPFHYYKEHGQICDAMIGYISRHIRRVRTMGDGSEEELPPDPAMGKQLREYMAMGERVLENMARWRQAQ